MKKKFQELNNKKIKYKIWKFIKKKTAELLSFFIIFTNYANFSTVDSNLGSFLRKI